MIKLVNTVDVKYIQQFVDKTELKYFSDMPISSLSCWHCNVDCVVINICFQTYFQRLSDPDSDDITPLLTANIMGRYITHIQMLNTYFRIFLRGRLCTRSTSASDICNKFTGNSISKVANRLFSTIIISFGKTVIVFWYL